MSEALEIIPVGWRPPRPPPLSRLEDRMGVDGFILTAEEIVDAWTHHRMYPVALASTVDTDAALLLGAWLGKSRNRFEPSQLPWVPVGTVGPLLVLGHMGPSLCPPPLPWGTFQGVCLRRDDYERQLANVSLVLEGRDQTENPWVLQGSGGGVGCFPGTLVMPTDRGNALRFVAEYFLHRPENVGAFEAALAKGEAPDEDLPLGYAAALWFLTNSGAVVQPVNVRLLESGQRRVPETLRKRISVVAEVGLHLWCAAGTLPQAEAEDRLYAELGEGWRVNWLLRAPEEQPTRLSAAASTTPSGTAAPFKIVLPGSGGPRGGKVDVVEAEERLIVLEERDWARFDPRHRDSAEPESLWKWAVYKSLLDGATDLHIEPGPANTRVRQRIDGLLEEILEVPTAVGEAMVYSLMTQVGLGSDKYRPVDGSFQVEVVAKVSSRHQTVRVRANAYPVRGVTQKIALRFLPRQGVVPSLDALLSHRPAKYLNRAISRPEGLVLVCGPTGSGKTTTIFSALSVLNRADVNVTTLENPVEILLEGTNQAEVNPRRDVTWDVLNRAFLRQDPDIGLIGEIRDEDTAKTILRAALTGHLVFGSLHTKSCPTSVIRMTDLGAEANMLAESLILVECQRLIRRVCPQCRRERAPTAVEIDLYRKHAVRPPEVLLDPSPHSHDCEHCRGRGYRGRAAAVEVLPNVPAVRQMIEERAVSQVYADWMRTHGLQTVFENALELAAAGVTSLEEALTLQDAWDGEEWKHLY
jgi:type II secretory ATPase GspE/PulE/Tfp pilus assembly ATPase PilB-like protein